MDKCSSSFFDGGNTAGLEQTMNYVTQQIGRKPECLEEDIIGLLHGNCARRLSYRFTTNVNNHMLAGETDDQSGIIELTEDFACAFKAVPVYAQSTGDIAGKVAKANGKIYQDMSVCGSQPLASFLSLSSGIPANASAQADLHHAIKDIALYNNTYGVPVVGGDVRFNNSKQNGITANLLTVGLIDKETRLQSACHGECNPVYLVGAPDPGKQLQSNAFIARSLFEMICDLNDEGAIIAIQSISESGIVGACVDMIIHGTRGIELNADILVSEPANLKSLLEYIPDKVMMIVKAEHGKKLEKICRKWNMRCLQAGVVIGEHKLSVMQGQAPVVDLPATVLSLFGDSMPEKDIQPGAVTNSKALPVEVSLPEEHKEVAKFMLTSCPNLLSQQWIFEQFDSTIGTNNLSTNFISDTPVLQIKGSRHAIAVSFCQNNNIGQYPEAVNLVVAESLRKAVCSGGEPRALTGCLNYSGAMDAKMEKNLRVVNEYITHACQKLGVSTSGINMNHAVTSGKPAIDNLSIGTIAFLNDKHQHMTMSFKGKGDMIYMLGKSTDDLNSSEYIRNYHDINNTPPPSIDMDVEARLLQVAQKVITRKLVRSAHSISKGGLFMALLESAMVRSFGFDITADDEIRKDAFLFGESPSRIVASVAVSREADFIDFMMESGVPFLTLGHVTREEIRIDDNSYGFISDYKKKYFRQ